MAADPTLVGAAPEKVAGGARCRARRVGGRRRRWRRCSPASAATWPSGSRDVDDVRDRIVAQLSGLPAPGVPERDEPFVLVARRPRAGRHRDPRPGDLRRARHGGGRADVPHRDPRPRTRHPGGRRCPGRARHRRPARSCSSTGRPAWCSRTRPREQIDAGAQGGGAGPYVRRARPNGRRAARSRCSPTSATRRGWPRPSRPTPRGSGLFRTEFCFLGRTEAPTIDEQVTAYRAVFAAFPGKKVVVRTLDAGADKPLPFLNPATEANPALGVRGLRTSWPRPELCSTTSSRRSRRRPRRNRPTVWVMAPMVATAREARDFVARCADRRPRDRRGHGRGARCGAAAPTRCTRVGRGFASIGTNDLTQYTMAADRLLGELAQPQRPVAARCAAPGRAHLCRGRRQRDRPVGRVRRGRGRPGAGVRAGRDSAYRACR